MVERQPARALKSLAQLLRALESDAKTHVSDWHAEQTVHVISIVHSHHENHRHSADTMLQLAERHQQQAEYSRRAFVTASATAALEFASAGDRRSAARALQQARAAAKGLRPPEKLFQQATKVVAAMPPRPA